MGGSFDLGFAHTFSSDLQIWTIFKISQIEDQHPKLRMNPSPTLITLVASIFKIETIARGRR